MLQDQPAGRTPTRPPGITPRNYDEAQFLALSAEREAWQRHGRAMWANGYRAAETDARRVLTLTDLREAYTAGQRAACPDKPGFDQGWAACLDRFADLVGGRVYPTARAQWAEDERRRWTRHSPKCRRRGGRLSCDYARCIPGPRADFGKPAPWDRPGTDPQ